MWKPCIALLSAILQLVAATSAAPPACQTVAPNQTVIPLPSTNILVPQSPWGLIYASDDIAFVSLGNYLGVLNTSSSTPHIIRTIPLPHYSIFNDSSTDDNGAGELTISRDKQEVWVTLGPGAVVVDVEKAVLGDDDAIIGKLDTPTFSSASEIVLSTDEDYAFISQEYGNNAIESRGVVQVFRVNRSSDGTVSGVYIGYTELQLAVVGMALSADGQSLFVTSEATLDSVIHSGDRGIVSILDVPMLKTNPSKALKTSVDAGCEPVRVAVSPDGRHVWVTARHSNQVVVFDSAKLTTNQSSNALVATIQVGTSPVGLIFVNNGRHVITADSNRESYPGATTGLTIIDVDAALAGAQRFPHASTGLFARALTASPNGLTLLVSQYDSHAVQSLDISHLRPNGYRYFPIFSSYIPSNWSRFSIII